MSDGMRRTVERAIVALRTLAHDLEHELALGEDVCRHKQRMADRLQRAQDTEDRRVRIRRLARVAEAFDIKMCSRLEAWASD